MYCLHAQGKGNLILRGNERLALRRELGGRKSMKTKVFALAVEILLLDIYAQGQSEENLKATLLQKPLL